MLSRVVAHKNFSRKNKWRKNLGICENWAPPCRRNHLITCDKRQSVQSSTSFLCEPIQVKKKQISSARSFVLHTCWFLERSFYVRYVCFFLDTERTLRVLNWSDSKTILKTILFLFRVFLKFETTSHVFCAPRTSTQKTPRVARLNTLFLNAPRRQSIGGAESLLFFVFSFRGVVEEKQQRASLFFFF